MTDKSFVLNKKDLSPAKDGSLVIYNRPALDGGVSPIFQIGIKIPSHRPIRISSKTRDEAEATRIAKDKYDELFLKYKMNKPVRLVGVKQAIQEFNEWYRETKDSKVKLENREQYISTLNRYPYEFFVEINQNISVDLIDDALVQDYFNWRRDSHGTSNNTLRREMTIFRSMLTFCMRNKKYIEVIPDYRLPARERIRRPAWNLNQYRKIVRKMRDWTDGDANSRVRRQRFYFQQFFLISANCGARVGELRDLTWDRIRTEKYENDEERIVLSVEGKTGRRDVVCNPDTGIYFDRLWDFRSSEATDGVVPTDEKIFCHYDGTPVGSMKKSFISLMEYCDTERDVFGQKYTIYSLRHFYAQMRLNEGVNVYNLASNMGTSTDMISRFYDAPNNVTRGLDISKTSRKGSKKTHAKTYPYK